MPLIPSGRSMEDWRSHPHNGSSFFLSGAKWQKLNSALTLLPTLLAHLTANQGRCSAGTGTCFDSPHPGAPFQGMRMKRCLHPEPWAHRFEPRVPAGNMPRRPTFLCLTHWAERPPGWRSLGSGCHLSERQNPGWCRGLT